MTKEISAHCGVTLQMSVRVTQSDAAHLLNNLVGNKDCFSIGTFAIPTGIIARAKWLLACELKRRKLPQIAPLLGDLTWALLLDLFVRDAESKVTSVSSATIGTGMPMTTALRYLESLVSSGYVQRCPHPSDERVVLISLTPYGQSNIAAMIAKLA